MKLVFSVLLATVLLAGCASNAGMLNVGVTDAPDNIGDFTSLTVSVDKITLTQDGKTHDYAPAAGTFDLTKLNHGNLSTLFHDKVDTGNYSRLELHLSGAQGILKATGKTVQVKTPSDRLFLDTPFTVSAGKETNFVFDIQVHQEGNGDYIFKPNAGGSSAK